MFKMGEFKTISVLPRTFQQIGLFSTVTGKPNYQVLYELCNQLEEILSRSVQNKGEFCFNWQIMTQIVGNKLTIIFVSKAKLVAEKIPLDSDAPTVSEMERKLNLFGDGDKK